jgi:hypothetical protein
MSFRHHFSWSATGGLKKGAADAALPAPAIVASLVKDDL